MTYAKCCIPNSAVKTPESVLRLAHRRFHVRNPARIPQECMCCDCDNPGDRDAEMPEQCGCGNIREVIHEIEAPVISRNELKTAIEENLMIPPTLNISAVAYDIVHRDKHDDYMNKAERRESIPYSTWMNLSEFPTIPDNNVLLFKSKAKFEYTETLKRNVNIIEDEMVSSVINSAQYATIIPMNAVPGYIERAIVHDDNGVVEFFRSDCGMALYYIFTCIGYSALYEVIWRTFGVKFEFNTVKKVSDLGDLSIPCGVRDMRVGGSHEAAQKELV